MRTLLVVIVAVYCLFIGVVLASPQSFIAPLAEYEESSGFGLRRDPMGGAFERMHAGVDLRAPVGAEVRATAIGRVAAVWYPAGTPLSGGRISRGHPLLGGAVLIKHTETVFTLSGHLSHVIAHEGMYVWPGRVIGIIGNTGISTGRHLHFEVLIAPQFEPPPPPEDPMDRRMRLLAHLGLELAVLRLPCLGF